MSNDQRMTYDNTYYAIDAYIDSITNKVIVKRGDKVAMLDSTSAIVLIYDKNSGLHKPYVTMRTAMALGLVTEFMFERCC